MLRSGDVAAVYRSLGDAATYTPAATGVAQAVRVIVADDGEAAREGSDARLIAGRLIVHVAASAVAAPKRGDAVDYDGVAYRVADVAADGGALGHRLVLRKV